ncbi:LPS export ABC transporter periplasmic protein LptC [bacterium]|nr:LPS export ABC transporter periplasmic protein LptC [bacterium]
MIKNIIRILYIVIAFHFLLTTASANEPEYFETKTQEEVAAQKNKGNLNLNSFLAEDNDYEETEEIALPNLLEKKQNKSDEKTAKQQEKTEIVLDSDKVFYNEETNEVEAKGNVKITTKPEKSKITADRAVYSRDLNTIKLYGNVKLHKDGATMVGDYLLVDLANDNILIDEPITKYGNLRIKAKEGYAYANKIEMVNGEIELAEQLDTIVASHGFGSFYDRRIIESHFATDELKKTRADKFKIHSKEIIIKSENDRDVVTFKDAEIFYKNFRVMRASNLDVFTDKSQGYAETNSAEFGSISKFGTYLGLGYVFKTPGSSTLKLVPALVTNSDDGLGVGLIARHQSKRNFLEGGWASNSKNLVLRGKYKFNKYWRADYGRHAYIPEWLNGSNRPGYLAQVSYHRKWLVKDLRANFEQRISAGLAAEYHEDSDLQKEAFSTMRYRYQAQLNKTFFSFGDKEQDVWLDVGAIGQVSATLYGTGDVNAFAKIGPSIDSRVNRWGSRINLLVGGIHGESPFWFDNYRYGRLSFNIDENIRINRYLAVGYRGTISPLKDNHRNELVTENRFYVLAGPEDIKCAVSYDSIRQRAAFDIYMMLGTNRYKNTYNKLTIQNPHYIGKEAKLFDDLKYYRLKVPTAQTL